MQHYANMLEAISGLRTQGYVVDFNLAKDCLTCMKSGNSIQPEEFNIDSFYRFEDLSNPDDNSILYAISSSHGTKGILVNAYGMYAEEMLLNLSQKFKIPN
jgi:hypothetical protein